MKINDNFQAGVNFSLKNLCRPFFYRIFAKNRDMATRTKGNVIVENIKIGDIHYEYEMGLGIKCEVISVPQKNKSGAWEWQSRNLNTGKIIDYLVDPSFPTHYSVNLYDYPAYNVKHYI